jgi:hypothetical protein
MNHDRNVENWSRQPNRQPGCSCQPWRYSPFAPRPTNPDCPEHGETRDA